MCIAFVCTWACDKSICWYSIPGNGDTWDSIFKLLLMSFTIMWTFCWNPVLRWDLGLQSHHWKKKSIDPFYDGSGRICDCPSFPISGQLGTAHMMTYNLMQKWNLLLLNSPSWQSDMLVLLCSYDCIYFWASWQRPTWNFGSVPSNPTKWIFASNIATSGLLGTAHI